ncbi:MAG: transposase [Clostridiales bacterium]|nr:transposase [Clostridiales bacterium]
MLSNKSYKFRIYPNKEQSNRIQQTFGSVRFLYNQMLADKIEYYEKTKESLYVTPKYYKTFYPWLYEVDAHALDYAKIHLEKAYKNFFENNKGFPRFKSKKRSKKAYTTCPSSIGATNVRIEGNKLRLPKVGFVKIKLTRKIPDDYRLVSVTISQSASGKYYASICYEYESQVTQIDPSKVYKENSIGLDYSMKSLYVDSNGREANYPRYYRKMEKKLARECRRLSHMQLGSHNREKQKVKIAKIHEKISNQRLDFLHKLSTQLAIKYDLICVEDIDLSAMSKSLHFGKSINDNGFGMFRFMLMYKLHDRGKEIVKTSKYYPSSQICHICNYRNYDVKDLSIREWYCPKCGTLHNRDVNAAINILNEGFNMYCDYHGIA